MSLKAASFFGSLALFGFAIGCDGGEDKTDDSGLDAGGTGTDDTALTSIPDDPVERILALTGDALLGELEYGARCSNCHGVDGTGISAPSLYDVVPPLTDEALVEVILYGTDYGMPDYEGQLTNQSFADLIAYLTSTYGG